MGIGLLLSILVPSTTTTVAPITTATRIVGAAPTAATTVAPSEAAAIIKTLVRTAGSAVMPLEVVARIEGYLRDAAATTEPLEAAATQRDIPRQATTSVAPDEVIALLAHLFRAALTSVPSQILVAALRPTSAIVWPPRVALDAGSASKYGQYFAIKVGATRPYLSLRFLDGNGNPIDLTRVSTITMRLLSSIDQSVALTAPAISLLTPPESGDAEYRWQPLDVSAAGRYGAEFDLNMVDGTVLTLPLLRQEPVPVLFTAALP